MGAKDVLRNPIRYGVISRDSSDHVIGTFLLFHIIKSKIRRFEDRMFEQSEIEPEKIEC